MSIRMLHLGMPKCGSTYLQNTIFSNTLNTRIVSQFTPEQPLSRLIIQNADAWIQAHLDDIHHFQNHPLSGLGWNVRDINQEIHDLEDENLILSSEYLLGNDRFLNMDLSENLWFELSELIEPSLVLVVIRRQDTFLKSLYLNHYRQNSWRMTFDRFLSVINMDVLDYHSLLTSIFSNEKVLFLPSELMFKDEHRFIQLLSRHSRIKYTFCDRTEHPNNLKSRNLAMSSFSKRLLELSSFYQRQEIPMYGNRFIREFHRRYNMSFVELTRWVDQKIYGTLFYGDINIDNENVLDNYFFSNRILNDVLQSIDPDIDLNEFGYF